MSAIFPKWTSRLPLILIVGGMLTSTSVVGGLWYYFTPKYTRVGYQPIQPVGFPHSVHVDQLGLDCRYCHSAVEKSWYSNVPAATTCMNCHNQVLKDDSRLALVRESAATGKPIALIKQATAEEIKKACDVFDRFFLLGDEAKHCENSHSTLNSKMGGTGA